LSLYVPLSDGPSGPLHQVNFDRYVTLLKRTTGILRNGKVCRGEFGKTLVHTENAQEMLHVGTVKCVVV
jgi:hypothetical protein